MGIMYITMGDVEGQLLRELDEGHSQDSIALTYAFGIRDHHDRVDWKKINSERQNSYPRC